MKKLEKRIFIALGIILIAVMIGAGSYALWQITHTQEDTNIVTSGCFNTTTNFGEALDLTSTYPISDEDGMNTTPLSFTITNTCGDYAVYQVNLETFLGINKLSDDYVKVALDDNITILSSNDEVDTTIQDALKAYKLDTGGLSQGESITYNFRMWMDYATTIEQGRNKEFKASISIITSPGAKETLRDLIIAQGGGATAIQAKATPNFAQGPIPLYIYNQLSETEDKYIDRHWYSSIDNFSLESGMYASEDEYGMSYYYRGVVSNNNVVFGGFQWKIIRINGDGSIRLIYNGECPDNDCEINTVGDETQLAEASWSTSYEDAKNVGYMYGGETEAISTSRVTDINDPGYKVSTNAVYNQTDSKAKTVLDNWYETNIKGKIFESMIVDNIFCNDRQLQSEVGGEATGTGFGPEGTGTMYAAYHRLVTNKTPTFKCGLLNDQFTITSSSVGNKMLTYPVGLITADEFAFAGAVEELINYNHYLVTERFFWTFTPYSYEYEAYIFRDYISTLLAQGTSGYYGFRPVINLSSKVTAKSGDGSPEAPFVVGEL